MNWNHQYKVALALNDRGIKLLEGQCFQDGIDAFNKAFFLVKSLMAAIEQDDWTGLTEITELNQLLDTTTTKIPTTTTSTDETRSRDDTNNSRLCFVHITSERGPTNITLIEATSRIPCPETIFCIHLDDVMYGENDIQNANFDLDAGIMQFNLSNAYRANSISLRIRNGDNHAEHNESQKLLQRSWAIYKLALSVLSCVHTSDQIETTRYTLILIMILQGLIQLSSEIGFTDDGDRYTIQIENLRARLSKDDLQEYANNQRSIHLNLASAA